MEIKLTWDNPNTLYDGTYVYRSEEPFSVNNLPPAIADLPNGVTEYVDSDVVRGTKYYYRFGVYRGEDIAVSGQKEVWALPYTGPGPQQLQGGDWMTGYFGEVPAAELFTASELALLVGLTAGNAVNAGSPWLKFIDQGKVLFIPKQKLREGVTWNDIYEAGCVYGTDDEGKVPGANPTNQRKVVTKNGNSFLVRLMSGLGENVGEIADVDLAYPDYTGESEWDRLFARCLHYVSVTQVGENFDDIQFSELTTTGAAQQYTWCQESAPSGSGNRIMRGGHQAANHYSQIYFVPPGNYHAAYGWRPVLEFIPNDTFGE